MDLLLTIIVWLNYYIPNNKNKKRSLCDSDKYRAIVLSSIIGKVGVIIHCPANLYECNNQTVCNWSQALHTEGFVISPMLIEIKQGK